MKYPINKTIINSAWIATTNCVENRAVWQEQGDFDSIVSEELGAVVCHTEATIHLAELGYATKASHHAWMVTMHIDVIRELINDHDMPQYTEQLCDAEAYEYKAHTHAALVHDREQNKSAYAEHMEVVNK